MRKAGGSSDFRVLLVVNCDLEPECVDSELRVVLQWIAASELGLPALYFRRSKEMSIAKVGTAHNFWICDWTVFCDYYQLLQVCRLDFRDKSPIACKRMNPIFMHSFVLN